MRGRVKSDTLVEWVDWGFSAGRVKPSLVAPAVLRRDRGGGGWCRGAGWELGAAFGKIEVMGDSHSDAELIEASFDQPALFGLVFERHWDAVFRFFERRLGPEPSADLASEVFRIAFERRATYEIVGRATCLPWLYGIAANLAMKERRRFARHLAAIDRLTLLETGSQDDHAATVSARVDSEESWSRLRDAFITIDDTSREMLLLVAWEGLSYGDVAAIFGVPLGTVRSRLHRARARLRALLNSTDLKVNSESSRE